MGILSTRVHLQVYPVEGVEKGAVVPTKDPRRDI
jgi:hypothetical protein